MSQYGRVEYWDERYSRDLEPFEWHQRFSAVRDKIAQHIDPDFKVLNVGCGNSKMSEEMFEEGYQHIHNIDTSSVVIRMMSDKYRDKGPNFKYLQMDVKDLEYEDGSFDCVIDKGTFDSILCGESSPISTNKMLSEIHRVLTPKGVYICISYGHPEHRLLYLEKPEFDWTVIQDSVSKPSIATSALSNEDQDSMQMHYIYICTKTGTAVDSKDQEEVKESD